MKFLDIRVMLKVSQKLMFCVETFPQSWHLIVLKKRSSGVEPFILLEWSGGAWLWPKKGWIEVNFLANFWEHHFKCLEKFARKFTSTKPSFGQSQKHSLHFTQIGSLDTTWTLLEHHKRSLMGRTPYPKHEFSRGFEYYSLLQVFWPEFLIPNLLGVCWDQSC